MGINSVNSTDHRNHIGSSNWLIDSQIGFIFSLNSRASLSGKISAKEQLQSFHQNLPFQGAS